MMDEANVVAEFVINQTYQSWMRLSLLQFAPRRWADLLKDVGHRLPTTRAEHVNLQRARFRERIFEGSVFDLRGGGRRVLGGVGGRHLVDEDAEFMPSSMCLGDLGGSATASSIVVAVVESDGSIEVIDVHDDNYLIEGGDDSDVSSDDGQWGHEGQHDPISET